MSQKAQHNQPTQDQLSDYLTQVGHALNLVAELPEWLERSPFPKHPAHAIAETFAMNCRVLCDFFWGGKPNDITMRSYQIRRKLSVKKPNLKKMAPSKHVAHLTQERIKEPMVRMSYDDRAAVRDALLAAAEQFADNLADAAQSEKMSAFAAHARSLTTWPPPPTDREDPELFIAALAAVEMDPAR